MTNGNQWDCCAVLSEFRAGLIGKGKTTILVLPDGRLRVERQIEALGIALRREFHRGRLLR